MNYLKTSLYIVLVLTFSLLGSLKSLAQESNSLIPFVMPWDDNSNNLTNMSHYIEKPAGKYGFVYVKNGHLYAGNNRIRFFGTNISFEAVFPSHATAEKLAAHLARLGINCVRLHNFDSLIPPNGLLEKDKITINPIQMDKLDYFIYQLKLNGIYVDLNTHVGRIYPKMPALAEMSPHSKGLDIFYPPMIQLQKDYTKALLGHYNPYTKKTYANEPAIALIEINNEDSLVYEWSNGTILNKATPNIYKNELKKQWNNWLKTKYNVGLKEAWKDDVQPFGEEMILNKDFASGIANWNIEQNGTTKISHSLLNNNPNKSKILRLDVEQPSDKTWGCQLGQAGLSLKAGYNYTVSFWAKSDTSRDITIALGQAHAPWKSFASHTISLSDEWEKYEVVLPITDNDSNSRLVFSHLALKTGSVFLYDVSSKSGGIIHGLNPDEALGSVDVIQKSQMCDRTAIVRQDWLNFLIFTETNYWNSMRNYIKSDLKSRSLIIGTQNYYSPYSIQADMDVLDNHAYWQHPDFPHKAWDSVDWTVKNIPLSGQPSGETISKLAMSRVLGKPFIVTEYNHPAPNTYSSEAFLLLSSYAALQDWDGIFSFGYTVSNNLDLKRIRDFFDIDQHPTKLVTQIPSFSMFARGDVGTSLDTKTVYASTKEIRDAIYKYGSKIYADKFGMNPELALKYPVGLSLNPQSVNTTNDASICNPIESITKQLIWYEPTSQEEQGVVTVNTSMSKAVIGSTRRQKFVLNDVAITFGPNMQNWAALTLTKFGEFGFNSKGKILITATGYTQNTNMRWKDSTNSSVGNKWGEAPSLVEGIHADITLPVNLDRVTLWGLDGRGNRKIKIKVIDDNGKSIISIDKKYKTIWYEVEIK